MNWPVWTGGAAVIVASGPSAADVPLEEGKGKAQFLAVKDGWKLCPWASHLYGCDAHWWAAHRGVPDFQGQRICYDERTVEKYRGMNFLKIEIRKAYQTMLFDKIGHVGWGGNSGFHAINLAAQFGAKKIVLVGFDMRVDQGRHFFGDHPYTKDRPSQGSVDKWRPILEAQAPALADRGIEVINCSPVSTLKAWPKMSFAEALA